MKAIVAADTNLLRHPTPRRYITVIEALRMRPIVVLPTVNSELHRHLPIQAGEYIDTMARRKGLKASEHLLKAKRAAGKAAHDWWLKESQRNDSVYQHVPDLGPQRYAIEAASLPSDAFTNHNDGDQWIYAQAMVHEVNVIASHNRHTILTEVLQEHFVNCGYSDAPVAVSSLWEHTVAIAEAEGRPIAEIALETVLCATVPDNWSLSTVSVLSGRGR